MQMVRMSCTGGLYRLQYFCRAFLKVATKIDRKINSTFLTQGFELFVYKETEVKGYSCFFDNCVYCLSL